MSIVPAIACAGTGWAIITLIRGAVLYGPYGGENEPPSDPRR